MQVNANPSALCSKDASRYTIADPILDLADSTRPVLMATNGHALVVLPVFDVMPDETAGSIPRDALRDAFKAPKNDVNRGRVEANGTAKVLFNGSQHVRPDNGKGPDWRGVIPKFSSGSVRIALDASLLAKLQSVLTHASSSDVDAVELTISLDPQGGLDDSYPIVVRPTSTRERASDGSEAFGIIMPVAVKD